MATKGNQENTSKLNLKNYMPWAFAVIILFGYYKLVNFMVNQTNTEGEQWLKLTYIFKSVEAIVFTAVGFIFGKEVNRARAEKAEETASDARESEKEVKIKHQKLKQVNTKLALDVLDNTSSNTSNTFTIMSNEENDSLNRINNLRNLAKNSLNESK